jgi:hypothetical protein
MCSRSAATTDWAESSAHHLVEAAVPLVRHAAALAERPYDVVFHGSQHRDELRRHGDVDGRLACQPRGVLGRQRVDARLGVQLHDAARGHRPEPLPDVALVEPRRAGKALARRRAGLLQRVEEPGPVPDRDHHRQPGVVQHLGEAPCERLRAFGVTGHG